jgi:hypothetical protein
MTSSSRRRIFLELCQSKLSCLFLLIVLRLFLMKIRTSRLVFCYIIYIEFKGGWLHALKQSNRAFTQSECETKIGHYSTWDLITLETEDGLFNSTFKAFVRYRVNRWKRYKHAVEQRYGLELRSSLSHLLNWIKLLKYSFD